MNSYTIISTKQPSTMDYASQKGESIYIIIRLPKRPEYKNIKMKTSQRNSRDNIL